MLFLRYIHISFTLIHMGAYFEVLVRSAGALAIFYAYERATLVRNK